MKLQRWCNDLATTFSNENNGVQSQKLEEK